MNDTVTLSRLISRIAAATGTDANTSRRFLRELLNTVRERLQAGESVTIDGFGAFAPSADGSDVRFVPDQELAAEINRPFAMFQPVPLADDLSEEELEASVPDEPEDETVEEESEPEIKEEITEEVPAPEAVEEMPAPASQEVPAPEAKEEEPVSESEPARGPVPSFPEDEEQPLHERPDSHYDHQMEEKKQRGRAWLWFAAAATIIGCAGGYFAGTLMEIDDPESTRPADVRVEQPEVPVMVEEEVAPEDSARTEERGTASARPVTDAPQRLAAAEPVYDVVDGNNYLSVIAHRHYGVRNYWVFIYEANRDVIQNPNVIAPGTRVLIPPLESLPGSSDEERRQIASRKIAELSRR